MTRPTRRRASTDVPPPLGVGTTVDGPELAVVARHASRVEVCLFDSDGERRVPLTRSAHCTWWDVVPDLVPGARYGLRVDGPWEPGQGHRHNPDKLLLDPYGHAVEGGVTWAPQVYGHVVDARGHTDPDRRDVRDSAPFVPRSVVVDHAGFDWAGDTPPRVRRADTVVYEAHVRGLTMRHPRVPPRIRGTYAALGHPAVVDHLVSLGVTTLELLPIHAFTSEPALVHRELSNYWGYNSVGFFAPHPGYALAADPQGVVDEVKGAVRALHAAGIEVVLDVVYNHTAEQGSGEGATLSWRGLDNHTYYRLDDRGRDIDMTGCGNTVDLSQPLVVQMVLDSLRHWVESYHVDGFRFDLAPALARGRDDAYDRDHPFLVALRTDPVLSQVKLVAEPWDLGVHGWRTGQFPPPLAEWNDRYRDAVRTFWLSDVGGELEGAPGHAIGELATRLTGSADLFDADDLHPENRGPLASVNLVTSHDGFTLADLTTYQQKHNHANGEGNRDGHDDNRSWNHGVEGETDDPEVRVARRRSMRNLLATLLLSAGVPMLLGGDELGRSQQGNNNAYCQDNEASWLDWDLQPWQEELLADTRELLALRRELPVLRPSRTPLPEAAQGRVRWRWTDEHGRPVQDGQWHDPWRRTVVACLDTAHAEKPAERQAVALVLHAGPSRLDVVLPVVDGMPLWRLRWRSDTGEHVGENVAAGSSVTVGSTTLVVYVGEGGLRGRAEGGDA